MQKRKDFHYRPIRLHGKASLRCNAKLLSLMFANISLQNGVHYISKWNKELTNELRKSKIQPNKSRGKLFQNSAEMDNSDIQLSIYRLPVRLIEKNASVLGSKIFGAYKYWKRFLMDDLDLFSNRWSHSDFRTNTPRGLKLRI